jgi:predicted CoA-binding protein
MLEKYKCILSMRVAKHLIAEGFTVVDIEPSRRYSGKLVFVFLNTPNLEEELKKFERRGA